MNLSYLNWIQTLCMSCAYVIQLSYYLLAQRKPIFVYMRSRENVLRAWQTIVTIRRPCHSKKKFYQHWYVCEKHINLYKGGIVIVPFLRLRVLYNIVVSLSNCPLKWFTDLFVFYALMWLLCFLCVPFLPSRKYIFTLQRIYWGIYARKGINYYYGNDNEN